MLTLVPLVGSGSPWRGLRGGHEAATGEPDLGHASEGRGMNDTLKIAGRTFGSRLITGTGKYESFETMRDAVLASGSEMVTVAVRRIDFDARDEDITTFLPHDVLLLPNTAGSETADEAVRVARLARAGGLPDWIKLEVIPDPRYLLPDPVETLRAAATLVEDGFTVLPYMLPDPVLARKLEEVGCATVMPLAAPIGSGRGLKLRDSIRIMIEQGEVPVVVDAGLGSPSHAAEAMEMGADAVLVNTAIAHADDPVAMARAFRLAVEAGRLGYEAGIMDEAEAAQASSPVAGLVTQP
jgi:thiazole synthase